MTSSQAKLPARNTLPANSPALFASFLGVFLGLGLMFFSVYLFMFTKDSSPLPLVIALFILGLSETASSYFTILLKRVAWSFTLSLSGTASVVFLFTAPRIRDAIQVNIGVALLPCMAFGLIVLLYVLDEREF